MAADNDNAQPVIMTTIQVAKRLVYSDDQVRRLCEDGKLPGAYRSGVGGHWRVPESAVLAFLDGVRPKVRRRV